MAFVTKVVLGTAWVVTAAFCSHPPQTKWRLPPSAALQMTSLLSRTHSPPLPTPLWPRLTASAALQKRAIQFGTRIANRKLAGQRRLDGTEPLPCLNPRVGGR